jgi:hypothetical protein
MDLNGYAYIIYGSLIGIHWHCLAVLCFSPYGLTGRIISSSLKFFCGKKRMRVPWRPARLSLGWLSSVNWRTHFWVSLVLAYLLSGGFVIDILCIVEGFLSVDSPLRYSYTRSLICSL